MVLLFCKIRRPWAPPLFKVTRLRTWSIRLQVSRVHDMTCNITRVHEPTACKVTWVRTRCICLQVTRVHDTSFPSNRSTWSLFLKVTQVHASSVCKLQGYMIHLSTSYKNTWTIYLLSNKMRCMIHMSAICKSTWFIFLQGYTWKLPIFLQSYNLQEYRIHLSAW